MYQEGQVVELNCLHKVYHQVPRHMVDESGDYTLVNNLCDLRHHSKKFDYLRGNYVVTKITHEGGGRAHNDVIPDYMHVWCQSVDRPHITIVFLPDHNPCCKPVQPRVVGRATPNWTWEPTNA